MASNNPFTPRTYGQHKPKQQNRSIKTDWHDIYSDFVKSKDDYSVVEQIVQNTTISPYNRIVADEYIFRTKILMTSSAFDKYMHEILYKCFLYMRDNKIKKTDGYDAFCHNSRKKFYSGGDLNFFYKHLEWEYGKRTLASFKDWIDAIANMGLNTDRVATYILESLKEEINPKEKSVEKLEKTMNDHAHRRNKIAHCYDYDMIRGEQYDINADDAAQYISFMSTLAKSIYEISLKEWN